MGVITLVVEGGVPAEVSRRNIHSGGDVIAVGPEQTHPCLGIIVSQPGGIFPFQGENVRPNIPVVLIQFIHRFLQIHAVLVPKEAVVTQPLRPWTGGDVLHVAL